MFDLVGWSWVYEPLDAGGYIPDFLVQGAHPFFVEVGPCITEQDYREKAEKPSAAADELGHDVLVVGIGPLAPFQTSHDGYGGAHGSPGWFGEYSGDGPLWWDAGVWTTCQQHESTIDGAYDRRSGCDSLGVTSDSGSYVVRPCGHYPGGRVHLPVGLDAEERWAEAGNRVQWRRTA